jgi:hypothetical protein
MSGPLDTARAAWGAAIPDWIEVLAIECGRSSQIAVAKELGRSGAVISQVLRKVYPADLRHIEERVRGVFLDAKVPCPAMGEMPLQDCQDWREKARVFALGNPTRVRMYRACASCPRNQKEAVE